VNLFTVGFIGSSAMNFMLTDFTRDGGPATAPRTPTQAGKPRASRPTRTDGYSTTIPLYPVGRVTAPGLDVSGKVVAETVKLAGGGSGDLIVRVYESYDGRAADTLQLARPAAKAWTCDLLERPQEAARTESPGTIPVELGPSELRTIRIRFCRTRG
jgi:alpha-mannosidase